MKVNLEKEVDKDISIVANKLIEAGYNYEDLYYVYKEVKYGTEKFVLGYQIYPKLINKINEINVWLTLETEIEIDYDNKFLSKITSYIVNELKSVGLTPFMDEDSKYNHFVIDERKGYVILKCFVNPDYPDGDWENHTL